MSEAAFDALAFSKHLIQAGGFSQHQAEALAEGLSNAIQNASSGEADRSGLKDFASKECLAAELEKPCAKKADQSSLAELAAKDDIAGLESAIHKLDARLGGEIHKLDVKLSETKSDLIKWMIGLLLVFGGVLAAALVPLHGMLVEIMSGLPPAP